jgi:hypothetical protein
LDDAYASAEEQFGILRNEWRLPRTS